MDVPGAVTGTVTTGVAAAAGVLLIAAAGEGLAAPGATTAVTGVEAGAAMAPSALLRLLRLLPPLRLLE